MSKIKIEGNASGSGTLTITAPNTNTDRSLTLPDEAGEFVTADASGNVGIGTSSPAVAFHIAKSDAVLRLEDTDTSNKTDIYQIGGGGVAISDGTTERMRIDSSGNLLVGTTTSEGTGGVTLKTDGGIYASRAGRHFLNRESTDGDILRLQKDGTTVGIIGTYNSYVTMGHDDTGLLFNGDDNVIHPWNTSTNSNRDNVIDLGYSSGRFDDIYATNGTIQTSDRNEKQQIASLTDTEMNVAKRLSALFKTYKWNDSVEENGDNARTHSGIIAQDMQQAFTDEGLDASNYAMFISSTWWEKEISVDAVEEETDEEGNVITEGQDSYTYMDIKEEATEGYTEKTRLGVRYPELFAFINAYNDQRFADLETRIEALENA